MLIHQILIYSMNVLRFFFDAFKTVDGFKIVTELNDQRAVKNQNLNTCLSSQAVEDTNQIKI